jgi:Mce-associated membrane protein
MTEPENDAAKDETVSVDSEIEEQTAETAADTAEGAKEVAATDGKPARRINWGRILAYGVLPGLALVLALGAGYLKWLDTSARDAQVARVESLRVASDSTVAMLSYKPDTVEKDLGAARDRLTGNFKDSYTSLINDVVIPGAKEKQIAARANVPAAASVSATENHAVVLVFVNQTVIVGNDGPTNTASSVRVTLDKIGGRWLISDFMPV